MFSIRNMPEYVLDLEQLSGPQNDLLSRRINRLKNTCGCMAAWLGMLIAFLLLGAGWLYTDDWLSLSSAMAVPVFAGFIFILTLAAKALAVGSARVRLIWLAFSTIRLAEQS